MINVTKTYLPNKERFNEYIDRIYSSGWLTNNGQLHNELESRLKQYLGVKHLILVANGSIALQVAYKALGLHGEVITTPFSFAATTSTLVWEGLTPVFADIDPKTFNIDPHQIESKITERTSAIVPVHVFGNPCDVDAIHAIAQAHNLKVVYDGAHAFGVKYEGQSVLNFGNISTLSFHATKLFHTGEGGAVITNDDHLAQKIRRIINFGIVGPEKIDCLGINAKMNEFEAAMGLCVLEEIDAIKMGRKKIEETYREQLSLNLQFQQWNQSATKNYSYVPVLFRSEACRIKVQQALNDNNIFPRRYFYPSLDTLEFLQPQTVQNVSRDISNRVLCLPIYPDLELWRQQLIINIIEGA